MTRSETPHGEVRTTLGERFIDAPPSLALRMCRAVVRCGPRALEWMGDAFWYVLVIGWVVACWAFVIFVLWKLWRAVVG